MATNITVSGNSNNSNLVIDSTGATITESAAAVVAEVVAEVVVEEVVEEAVDEVAEDDWETKYNALLIEHNALKHKERALNTIVRGCLAYIN